MVHLLAYLLASTMSFAQTSVQPAAVEVSHLSQESLSISGHDIHNPQGFWFLMGAGAGYMAHAEGRQTEGLPTQLQFLGSYYFQLDPWVMDLGGGLHNQLLTERQSGSSMFDTAFASWSARYRLSNGWQMGPVWKTMIDSRNRFHSNTSHLASFVGVELMHEFPWQGSYLVRLGGRFMTDVGIGGGQVNSAMFVAQIGFGDGAQEASPVPAEVIPVSPAPVQVQ